MKKLVVRFMRWFHRKFHASRVYEIKFSGDQDWYRYGDILVFDSKVSHMYLGEGYVLMPKRQFYIPK